MQGSRPTFRQLDRKMIDRAYQPRAVIVHDALIEVPLLCDIISEFMNQVLYARYSWGAGMSDP